MNESFMIELEDFGQMIQSDMETIRADWRELYSKDYLVNILANYQKDFEEMISKIRSEEDADY